MYFLKNIKDHVDAILTDLRLQVGLCCRLRDGELDLFDNCDRDRAKAFWAGCAGDIQGHWPKLSSFFVYDCSLIGHFFAWESYCEALGFKNNFSAVHSNRQEFLDLFEHSRAQIERLWRGAACDDRWSHSDVLQKLNYGYLDSRVWDGERSGLIC